MQPIGALPPDIGTIKRPCFLGRGRIVLRRDGRWLVGATRLIVRQGSTDEGRTWTLATGQMPEVACERDEGAFAPVLDPAEATDLDARRLPAPGGLSSHRVVH